MVSMIEINNRCAEADLCSADPRYEEEVSGCTASVAIVSGKKIFVVSGVWTASGS